MELDCLRLFDVLEDYSKITKKALLVYIPTWENKSYEDIKEIVNFYENKMPEEIFNTLGKGEMRIIKYDNFELALNDAETYFPYVGSVEEKYRIDCYIIDENGKTSWSNYVQ
jgi:hypothetical protein